MNRNGLRYGGCELQKKIPLRMCVGCREMRPKRELVRVVCSKDGQISVDLTGKAAGRGAYVCPTEECLKKAVKTRALERAFSQKIEPEVFDRLAAQVEHSKTEPQNSAEEKREAVPDSPALTTTDAKLNNSIGLAMKAGKIASGDFSVEKAVRSGTAKLVMLDESASENTKKQWRDACSFRNIPLIRIRAMGSAIGKPARMVAAVTDEGFSAMIIKNSNKNNEAMTELTEAMTDDKG